MASRFVKRRSRSGSAQEMQQRQTLPASTAIQKRLPVHGGRDRGRRAVWRIACSKAAKVVLGTISVLAGTSNYMSEVCHVRTRAARMRT
jgi:hypothetical protein